MWDIILNPFITIIMLLYSLLGHNTFLAIVVLTFIIRFLMYPLMKQQQNSSKKMQEVQPKLDKIKEKYKDDREKLSQAQMELYREAGINPMGGCLPMVIQFPIIIGLYQAIFFALAATPFQIVDISERLLIPGLGALIPLENIWMGMDLTLPPTPPGNPIYALILPLLVMGTTFLQSKLTMGRGAGGGGGGAATMTQSMTMVMPVMMGMFALSLSLGVSIYFLVGNIVSIIQYSDVIEKVFKRGDHKEAAPVVDKIEIPAAKKKKAKS